MPPPVMEETPPIPPEVAGKMGAGPKTPFSGVGSMMANKPGGPGAGPEGGAKPMGALGTAADAVKKVINNMATMDKEGAPFAARISQMLDSWVAEAAKRGPAAAPGAAEQGGMSALPPSSSSAQTEGHGFTG